VSGAFPQCLTYCIGKPLFKKGDRMDVSNYRPISILTSFSKIIEKVIHNRLLEHVINNNILAKEHFEFMKNLTEKATYELSNEIIDAPDKKLLVGGIFCDIAKAFNCVNHDTLLLK
jgi:hypothetical protein